MWIHASEEIARNLQAKFMESSLADQDLLGSVRGIVGYLFVVTELLEGFRRSKMSCAPLAGVPRQRV